MASLMQKRYCVICGRAFYGHRGSKKTCSKACAKKNKLNLKRLPMHKRHRMLEAKKK